MSDMEIDVRVKIRGEELGMRYVVPAPDAAEIGPVREPAADDPAATFEFNKLVNRRQQFAELIASQISWSFVRALEKAER